jgi:endonuclease G
MSRSPRALVYLVVALAVALAAPATQARRAACSTQFLDGTEPALVNPRLAQQTELLCFHGFAVLHSGVTRTPLYAAEHLTRGRIEAAHGVRRVNQFHPEDRLPPEQRAEISDYARSGYDRGHMAPSGDMPDARSQAESFSLANMVPQAPRLNRGVWEGIESAVRDLAVQEGDIYVVTGPLFRGEELQALKGRVLVPSDTFKAVYDPERGGSAAYVCSNTNTPSCHVISVAALEQLSGIDAFPSLPAATKAVAMPLPEPEPYGRHRTRGHEQARAE